MDLRKVKKLIELFEESQLLEMEISEGDSVIRLSRGQPSGEVQLVQAQPTGPAAHRQETTTPQVEAGVLG